MMDAQGRAQEFGGTGRIQPGGGVKIKKIYFEFDWNFVKDRWTWMWIGGAI